MTRGHVDVDVARLCTEDVVVCVCCVQNAAAAGSAYAICPSCCGVIPRHQCGPSPPPHVVGCARHCSAASPGLGRPSPPPLLMQHPATTSPGASGFQQAAQPPPHVHDCPSYDRPPLSLEPGYHPGSWPDPVTVQCPIHGRYQPFVASFHQTVCSTDHLHLSHPHQFICHHQQPQPSHVYQPSYAVQSPQPSLINPPHYAAYSAVPASGVVDINSAAALSGDWYHPCVEFQHQPDCQLMSHLMTAPLMPQHQQQQQHDVAGVELSKTDSDVSNQRLEQSLQSADDADTSMSYQDQLTTAAAAAAACNTGDLCLSLDIYHVMFFYTHL